MANEDYQVTGANSVHVVDPRHPWVSLKARIAVAESALVDMQTLPTDAVKIPPYCKYVGVMALALAQPKGIVVSIYGFPPNAGNAAMNQGQIIASAVTLTTTARKGISIANGTTIDQYQSQEEVYDIRGYLYVAAKVTNVDGTTVELAVRPIG